MTTKKCIKCHQEKNLSDFYKKSKNNEKVRNICKECQVKGWREYYNQPDNKKRHLDSKKNYREKTRNSVRHVAGRLVMQSKKRAKISNIEHSITSDDFDIPECCPILGLKMQANDGGVAKANSYSLDRVNNNLGYIKGNVRVISYRANSIKSDASFEEHIKVAKYINSTKNFVQKLSEAIKAFFILMF